MTSEEIKRANAAETSTNSWLKEVALQLALMNELLSRKPGRPAKGK